jgi:hypothetical protein
MLQRMSDQHKISFLEGEKPSETPKKKVEKSKQTIQQIAEAQKSKRLNNKYNGNGIMNGQSIFSARTEIITDEGGPTKYMKGESSNTLWDNNKSARISQEIDSKTKTTQDKKVIADNKRYAEEKRMDTMVDALKSTDLTKGSAVVPSGSSSHTGTNYKNRSGSMSMFDTQDFQRLPEKTAGEQMSDDNVSRKGQKDDSWRGNSKSVKSSELVSDFFDQLLNRKEE